MSPEEIDAFIGYLDLVEFSPGARIVQESADGRDMYFIIEGEARLLRAHMHLGNISTGDHFGELALIAGRLRAASVVAMTRLVLARLSRERYDAMARQDPALSLRFTQALVGSLGVQLTEMTDSVGLLLRERSLPRRIWVDVALDGEVRRVKTGTVLRALLPADVNGSPVVAALLAHKAVSLSTPITSDASLSPLAGDHWEGKRVYRHSLGLLLLEAAHRVDPSVPVRLGPSTGFAQWIEHGGSTTLDPGAWADKVTRMMKDLAKVDVAFRQELWTVDEARSHFLEKGWHAAVLLLRTFRDGEVPMVSCGELYAIGMTPLLPGAKMIETFPFHLAPAEQGFLLHYGDEAEVFTPSSQPGAESRPPPRPDVRPPTDPPPPSRPKPLAVRRAAHGEELWLGALGVTSVGAFNEACITGDVAQIIRVAEGLHEKRIGQIADTISDRGGKVRVICIAGPSSSGKTTFIKRLTVQLQVNGIHPIGIGLDDYYLDREKTAKDEKGEYDFEAFEALDVALLHEHLRRLLRGEPVTTARYDFAHGKSLPDGGETVTLGEKQVLMLEGIHGLNPRLLAGILDRSGIFRVFIQPSTALPFDGLNRVNVSDLRLLRRIVRDRHQRAINAAANIRRWPAVRAGERAHIFPFLDQADALFDSALVYEPSVIKVFADRYLLEVPEDHPSFVTAYRLRQLIDRFITIYPDHVPPTSILREFIGGSGFEY
ncbi:MAG: cyclic nucleotide-binding domain-containing protein [Byssovorax sp.]